MKKLLVSLLLLGILGCGEEKAKVPKEEFLSKYDHEHFSDLEYKRLNKLLANPDLPFNNISFEKLTKPSNTNDDLDAISGATAKNVSEIVIKGAAYTTYKLWKIINGSSMEMVSHLTENQLTPNLINLILKSPVTSDKIWVLDRIDESTELTSELKNSMLSIISGANFYMAHNTLEAINSNLPIYESIKIENEVELESET
mgnify:CR=1 FL=1